MTDSIIYPLSINGNLKLSIELESNHPVHNLTHLESVYGNKENSWFETLCISSENKGSEKEIKVVSVFNRIVLTNVCMELSGLNKASRFNNISEYHSNAFMGEGAGKFLAINMDNQNSKTHQLNICNFQNRYFEIYNSYKTSIESALQDYIVSLHLTEINARISYGDIIYIIYIVPDRKPLNFATERPLITECTVHKLIRSGLKVAF